MSETGELLAALIRASNILGEAVRAMRRDPRDDWKARELLGLGVLIRRCAVCSDLLALPCHTVLGNVYCRHCAYTEC